MADGNTVKSFNSLLDQHRQNIEPNYILNTRKYKSNQPIKSIWAVQNQREQNKNNAQILGTYGPIK